MKIMKYVPNTLSITRLILAVAMFIFCFPHSPLFTFYAMTPLFLVLYTVAGITDMIDGSIARKFGVASPLGANLDGIADYVFVATSIILIVPQIVVSTMLVAVIVVGIVVGKGVGMIVGYIRYRQLMMMHTYASKTCALLAFLFPLIYAGSNLGANAILGFICVIIYIYLLEEIAINMVLPEPTRDISGIFMALRIRREKREQ